MKVVSLVSGGIDSPVAAYLMLNRGVEVVGLHLDNRPFTDDSTLHKTNTLIQRLDELFNTKIKTYVAPHGDAQTEIARNCGRRFQCVLCKRMMYRIGGRVAEKENACALVTGESLGQVASQTLQNLRVLTEAASVPVLRPLIGFDKEDTIKIARRIGTYDTSTQPGLCCTIVPDKPSTSARMDEILEEEKKINVDEMIEDSVSRMRVL